MKPLILASASPRRRELLSLTGLPFEVAPTDADENISLPAPQAVEELSRRKAESARRVHPGRWILAADTLVTLDGAILGKPQDVADACRMLRLLSARTHQVYTGVTILRPDGFLVSAVDRSDVTFAPLSEEIIAAYVATGEPMDKAGAYALQGITAQWISRVEGSPSGVIGLPLFTVRRLLEQTDYPFDSHE